MEAQEIFDLLSAPFPNESVDWRIGSTNADKSKASALAYIDARTVMDRLDAVCGPSNWQCKHTPFDSKMALCELGIKINGEWIWKSDGAGATDVEGEKGMLSDALKRAAVHWGIGRYLYGLDSPWVEIEPAGRSFRIKKSELARLEEIHEKEAQKVGWGGPTEVAAYRFLVRIVQETVTQASDAIAFEENYKSMFPLLRVAMRRHLLNLLANIGERSQKQAAE